MTADLDLFGIFVPHLLVLAFAALLASLLLKRILAVAGAYRLVWHPALFDLAVYVILLGGLDLAFSRYLS
ncbi:DUF1656 domain-containing protein [Aureimonas leprariae]|uniref:DUF1656 domain-containing protein n=1 Tax=Plantimonas leprariae TaxID=2615207 RepID=A0A7V7PMK3_9HYPH|nr:DUF1656 domain-containing protein [Aureimonas leprariae]KAB0678475.1 DUF1656 domain-containing protein [Aureimonas leprariae]